VAVHTKKTSVEAEPARLECVISRNRASSSVETSVETEPARLVDAAKPSPEEVRTAEVQETPEQALIQTQKEQDPIGSGRLPLSGEASQSTDEAAASNLSTVTLATCQAICFKDRSLLRGTSLTTCLFSLGALFQTSEGCARTYERSEVCDYLDAFISHNWSVSRTTKFLALAVHHRLRTAIVASVFVSAITNALQVWLLVFPSVGRRHAGNIGMQETYPYGGLLGVCVFYSVLFFYGEIVTMLPKKLSAPLFTVRSRIFLDKTCIHQTNMDLKRQGIEALGAYIYYSANLVVLYSDVYLRKMWTLYELGTFVLLHPDTLPTILPTLFTKTFLAGNCILLLSAVVELVVSVIWREATTPLAAIGYGFAVLLPFGLAIALRYWAKQLHRTREQIRTCSLLNTKCAEEADRKLVCANMIALTRELQLVTEKESDDDCIQMVDLLMQNLLFESVTSSLGPAGLPYHYVLGMCVPLLLDAMDQITSDIVARETIGIERVLARINQELVFCTAALPAAVAALGIFTRQCIHLQGCAQAFYLCLSPIVFYATWTFFLFPTWIDFGNWALFALYFLVHLPLVVFLYGGRPCKRRSDFKKRAKFTRRLSEADRNQQFEEEIEYVREATEVRQKKLLDIWRGQSSGAVLAASR